jgi:hypothetical protein
MERLTQEELMIWFAIYSVEAEEHEAAMKKARRR